MLELVVENKRSFTKNCQELVHYFIREVAPNHPGYELNRGVLWLHGRKELNRFLIGRGGSHIWISRRNGARVAKIEEKADSSKKIK